MIDGKEMELGNWALKLWGVGSQLDMMVEECAELIDAIRKYKRGRATKEKICEEMGDVQNCLNQFIPKFPAFEEGRQGKLARLKDLINRELTEKGLTERV